MTLTYDPLAARPENIVSDENIQVTTAVVIPTYAPFYLDDFKVIGTHIDGSLDLLTFPEDYSYSPLHSYQTERTGHDVYQYITLLRHTMFTSVRLSYRAVGCPLDTTALAQVVQLPPEKPHVSNPWLTVGGIPDSQHVYHPDGSGPLESATDGIQRLLQQMGVTPEEDLVFRDVDVQKRIVSLYNGSVTISPRITYAETGTAGGTYLASEMDMRLTNNDYKAIPVGLLAAVTEKLIADIISHRHVVARIGNPWITYPTSLVLDYTHKHAITLSMYLNSKYYQGPNTGTDWELATDVNFTNITTRSYNNSVELSGWRPMNLMPSTRYYVRGRYLSNNHRSLWSPAVTFVTAVDLRSIGKPKITFPIADTTDVNVQPIVQCSSIIMLVGVVNHTGSSWEIYLDPELTQLAYSSYNDSDYMSHHLVSALDTLVTYYIRVMHHGEGISSVWSDPVRFTTLDEPFVPLLQSVQHRFNDDRILSIAPDTDGTIIAVGYSLPSIGTETEYYIARYDRNLTILNMLYWGTGALTSVAITDTGCSAVTADGVVFDMDYNLTITATTTLPILTSSSVSHLNGVLVVGGSVDRYPTLTIVGGATVKLTGILDGTVKGTLILDSGDIVAVGVVNNTTTGENGFIAILSAGLVMQYAILLSSTDSGDDGLNDVAVDSLGYLIACGYTTDNSAVTRTAYTVKLDGQLNIISQLSHSGGALDEYTAISIVNDSVLLAGNTASYGADNYQTTDQLLTRTNTTLNILDVISIGNVGEDKATSVCYDTNYIFLGGSLAAPSSSFALTRIDYGMLATQTDAYTYPGLVITHPVFVTRIAQLIAVVPPLTTLTI